MQELDSYLFAEPNLTKVDSSENFYQECEDLWSAKKITPYCLPQKHGTFLCCFIDHRLEVKCSSSKFSFSRKLDWTNTSLRDFGNYDIFCAQC